MTSPCLAVAATAPLASSFALESVSEISEEHRNLASEWMHEVRVIMVVLLHRDWCKKIGTGPEFDYRIRAYKTLAFYQNLGFSGCTQWSFLASFCPKIPYFRIKSY